MRKETLTLTLGGAPRLLAWDNASLLDYEDAASFKAGDGTVIRASALEGIQLTTTRDIVAAIYACACAGARHERRPPPSLSEVRGWLLTDDDDALVRVANEALDLIVANRPDAQEATGEERDEGTPDPSPDPANGSEKPSATESLNSDSTKTSSGD